MRRPFLYAKSRRISIILFLLLVFDSFTFYSVFSRRISMVLLTLR